MSFAILKHLVRKSQGSRRLKRFYQRAKSGLDMARRKGEFLAFLTLTSSLSSNRKISYSWDVLRKRIYRKFGRVEYIWVREFTKSGLEHMHLIIRGPYIPQDWLSRNWEDIHGAKVVYIEAIWDFGKAVRYMVKYMTKEMEGRFGYSWGWIFRGASTVWRKLCGYVFGMGGGISEVLFLWDGVLDFMIGRERSRVRFSFGFT